MKRTTTVSMQCNGIAPIVKSLIAQDILGCPWTYLAFSVVRRVRNDRKITSSSNPSPLAGEGRVRGSKNGSYFSVPPKTNTLTIPQGVSSPLTRVRSRLVRS